MPSFKGQLTHAADRRRRRLRRQGDRRQPDRLTLSRRDFPRDVAVVATDLDRTLDLARTACCGRARWRRSRGARRPGLDVIVVTGRMVQSVRRFLEPARARRAGRLLPGRRRRRPGRASGSATSRSRSTLAREAIEAVEAAGFQLNVLRRRRAVRRRGDAGGARATPASSTSRSTRSATCSLARREPPTKLVASATRRRSTSSRRELKRALRRPALHLEVAAVLPRVRAPGVTKGAGLEFLAERLGFTRRADGRVRRRRERRRAARLGRLRRRGRERARRACKAVADWVCPPAQEEGVASVLEALLDSSGVIDLRAARTDPDGFRRRARAQGRGRGRSTSCSPPTRAGASCSRRSTSCARARS